MPNVFSSYFRFNVPTASFIKSDAQTEHYNFAFYLPAPKCELVIQNELDDLSIPPAKGIIHFGLT